MKFKRNIKGNEVVKINGMYQSRYFHDASFVYNKLNEISPSFCLAKWFNVSIHIPTGKTHSCYHPPVHSIPLEEIAIDSSALHNTKYKKQQRQLMLEGKRPSECEFCWQIEDSGNQLSDRAYRSKDIYEEGMFEEALQIGSQKNAKPRYVEVNFNQACNFKCSYCSPHLSTAWQQEIEKHGPYELHDRIHNDIKWLKSQSSIDNSPDNPYLIAFWKWFPTIYSSLQTFRMTGGEPLMDKNTFKIFDYVKLNPKNDLHLSITSNCCPPGEQWQKFMTAIRDMAADDCFDHFMLFCSLDSWGEQAEYIRHGMEFERLIANVKDFLSNGDRHSLTFIITFNALSYTRIEDYMKNILELRRKHSHNRQMIWFDIPQLSQPDFLNPKILLSMVDRLESAKNFMLENKEEKTQQFKGFSDFEVSKVQRLIDWIKADSDFNVELARKNFFLFFKEHDKKRGTDFEKIFPELKEFRKQCETIYGI